MSLEEKAFPIQSICRVMGISRASYYRACRPAEDAQRSLSMVSEGDEALAGTIRQIQSQWPGYGVRRVWAVLRFDYGLVINIKRVRRVMRAYRDQSMDPSNKFEERLTRLEKSVPR